MRLLGIDYGSKRIGIAYCDEAGQFAMPLIVLANSKVLLSEVVGIAKEKEIKEIVIGESKNYNGEANSILAESLDFRKELEATGFIVHLEPEFMTSAHAEKLQGKNDMLDASAAALILQSYLDKQKAQNKIPKVTFDDFAKIEIKVGKILSAEKVPNTDKLLKLSVDFAENAPRQIVSGISAYFPDPSTLVGKTCMFVTNLEPRTIKGLESNGMLFALSDTEGHFSLLEPNSTISPGTKAK
ncbi:MAG: Holliday junction resolvase RuvX [Candidatus Taylorbacteria bacterium]|nr:Holliday junction resolvase RuvX [Candidatus Taylorbacteria bacterium]